MAWALPAGAIPAIAFIPPLRYGDTGSIGAREKEVIRWFVISIIEYFLSIKNLKNNFNNNRQSEVCFNNNIVS